MLGFPAMYHEPNSGPTVIRQLQPNSRSLLGFIDFVIIPFTSWDHRAGACRAHVQQDVAGQHHGRTTGDAVGIQPPLNRWHGMGKLQGGSRVTDHMCNSVIEVAVANSCWVSYRGVCTMSNPRWCHPLWCTMYNETVDVSNRGFQ